MRAPAASSGGQKGQGCIVLDSFPRASFDKSSAGRARPSAGLIMECTSDKTSILVRVAPIGPLEFRADRDGTGSSLATRGLGNIGFRNEAGVSRERRSSHRVGLAPIPFDEP